MNFNFLILRFNFVCKIFFALLIAVSLQSCNKAKQSDRARRAGGGNARKPDETTNKPKIVLPPVSEEIQKSAVEYSMASKLLFVEAKCLENDCSIKATNSAKANFTFLSSKILTDKIVGLGIKPKDVFSVFFKTNKSTLDSQKNAGENKIEFEADKRTEEEETQPSVASTYSAIGFQIRNTIYYLSNIRTLNNLQESTDIINSVEVFTNEIKPNDLLINDPPTNEPQVLEASINDYYITGVGTEAGEKIQITLTDFGTREIQSITINKSLLSTLADRDPYLDSKVRFSVIYDEKNIIGFCIRNFKSVVF